MQTARPVLLASMFLGVATLASAARADWPTLFVKRESAPSSTSEGFWNSSRPNFGSPAAPRTRPEPAKPSVWSRMGSGSKRFYNNTAGRVGMPKFKAKPVSVTGHHTPWTRPKSQPESSGGLFSWFQSKPSEPARSTDEFFSLKRPD